MLCAHYDGVRRRYVRDVTVSERDAHLVEYVESAIQRMDLQELRCDILHPEVDGPSPHVDHRHARQGPHEKGSDVEEAVCAAKGPTKRGADGEDHLERQKAEDALQSEFTGD
jgi:hypothetical protein